MTNQELQNLFEQTQENYELIPQFLDQLLETDVYCLGTQDNHHQIQFRVLETPEGDQAIPFFILLETIQNDIGEDAEYVQLNTRKLFEMTKGATLVLNPTSELAKEFLADEIESILNMEQSEIDAEDESN